MARIKVLARVGDTVHPRYGRLSVGQELEIEEADFGEEIFRRRESGYEAERVEETEEERWEGTSETASSKEKRLKGV